MNQLNKAFRADLERKIIPFQLIKTNYGFSSASGDDLLAVNSDLQLRDKGFRLTSLDQSASFIAIAYRQPDPSAVDQSLIVSSVATSPIGETELRLYLQPGEDHVIYVISNKYKDGFISEVTANGRPGLVDETVNQEGAQSEIGTPAERRQVFNLGSSTDRIVVDGLNLFETTPEDDWYPYEGKYEAEGLLWADPTPLFTVAEGVQRQSSYSYLTYERAYLESIVTDIAKAYGVDGPDARQYLGDLVRRDPLDLSQTDLTNYYNADSLRGFRARRDTTLTHRKWRDNPQLTGADPSAQTLRRLESRNGAYDERYFQLIGKAPSDRNENDPHPEWNLRESLEQHLAGLVVIFEYVVRPYNTGPRSFDRDFNRQSSPGGPFSNRQFDELARRVRASQRVIFETQGQKDAPVLFEEGNTVFQTISRIISGPNDTNNGGDLIEYISERVNYYETMLTERSDYGGLFYDPFTDNPDDFKEALRIQSQGALGAAFAYADRRLTEIDNNIIQLGDFAFIPTPQGADDGVPPLAHEATLQNIRFLRNLIEESHEDLWQQTSNLNTFLLETMLNLRNNLTIDVARSNSITNITNANQVDPSREIQVVIRKIDETDSEWQPLIGEVIYQGNGVYSMDIGYLQDPGKYAVMIRPKPIEIAINRITGEGIVATPSLADYQADNYFYGWNIEFSQAGAQGLPLGDQRVIVGSKFSSQATELLISPVIEASPDFIEQSVARIWSNKFTPVMIDLDLTEYDLETLAYANYAKREFNRENGVLTLYRFDGSVYKTWALGERANPDDRFRPIEFRLPLNGGE